jgi:SAM-dependent methyltransferase
MTNPWLQIPLSDYEAHMVLPHVRQAQLLSSILGSALDTYKPQSIALLGCAGGNGLEQLEGRSVSRVVAVDINPTYVEHARARWHGRIEALDLVVGDVERDDLNIAPVEMAFAGLLLEYVDIAAALPRMRSMVCLGGTLVTVLQVASAVTPEVTPSPYNSLSALSSIMRLVQPDRLKALAEEHGFQQIDVRSVQVEGGKHFVLQSFRSVQVKREGA